MGANFDIIQRNFSYGEFSPTAQGRSDLQQYYLGLGRALNARTSVEGFVGRRFGLEFIDDIVQTTNESVEITDITNNGTANQQIDTGDSSILTRTLTITAGSTINGFFSGRPTLLSRASTSDSWEFCAISTTFPGGVGHTGEEVTFSIPENCRTHRYFQIRMERTRTSSINESLYNIGNSTITVTRVATIDLDNPELFTRLITFEAHPELIFLLIGASMYIYENGFIAQTLILPRLQNVNTAEVGYAGQANTLLLFHQDISPYSLTLDSVTSLWEVNDLGFSNIPRIAFSGEISENLASTLTLPTNSGRMTITASTGIFRSSHVGQFIEVITNGLGRMRIERVSSNTEAVVVVVSPIEVADEASDGTITLAADQWELQRGYDEIWSATRGYPRRATFHDGRLWIDGGRSLPSFLYASRINDFFNFDFGNASDSDAIGALQRSLSAIEAIYSGRQLSIFASDGEYIIQQVTGEPITPSNVNMTNQTSKGSAPNLIPQQTSGSILFVDRNLNSIQQFVYDETVNAFNSNNVSLLASHLVKDPVDFGLRREISAADGAYLMIVRGDGGLTLANLSREQNISSFVDVETDGQFLACVADRDTMYFIVRRGNRLQLERFNPTALLDNCTLTDSVAITDGYFNVPTHIANDEPVRVVAYAPQMEAYCDFGERAVENGFVVIKATDLPEDLQFQVGLNYEVQITTLPLEFPLDQRSLTLTGRELNVSEVTLQLHDSYFVQVDSAAKNDPKQNFEYIDKNLYFEGIKVYKKLNRFVRHTGFTGYEFGGQMDIRQDIPVPLSILQIKYRVSSREN